MGTKSKSSKKPKLTGRHLGNVHDSMAATMAGSDSPSSQDGKGSTPEKHKMTFAQHQHELQQQKSASHK